MTPAPPVFSSEEHFYTVMREVFRRVAEDPKNVSEIAHSNLVMRIRVTNPEAEILVDGRQPPLEVFFGKRPGDANVEVSLAADLLHALWLGKESTRQAFFGGLIKTRGNMLKMMRLTELFYECEKVYPNVARAHGLA